MNPFDTAWLAASVRLAAPLALAATGELASELSGVLNVGLEGMMLVGAFFSFWAASATGSLWVGVLGGAAAGMALAAVMAFAALRLRADQIVVGIALNILALGITNALFESVFSANQSTNNVGTIRDVSVPVLSGIPLLGKVLFDQNPFMYILYALVPAMWFVLFRTTWGLKIRAVGETPEAADAAGINVNLVRAASTLTAGALAGVAGAFLSIGQLGLFVEGMSAGRGFLALAAVIFGRWRPFPVLAACLIFGGADAIQLRLQAAVSVPNEVWAAIALSAVLYLAWLAVRGRARTIPPGGLAAALGVIAGGAILFAVSPAWHFPSQLWLALPYVLALVTLAGVQGRTNAPSALTVPYGGAGATI